MKIRKYKSTDYKEIADLFNATVHSVCAKDYSKDELEAWAPQPINYEKWQKRLKEKMPFVVTKDSKIVGFAELEKDGHIGCFYIHKDCQKQGIGTLLLNHLIKTTKANKLYAEVSITAKTFFSRHHFKTIKENTVCINNQELTNYIMVKQLIRENSS